MSDTIVKYAFSCTGTSDDEIPCKETRFYCFTIDTRGTGFGAVVCSEKHGAHDSTGAVVSDENSSHDESGANVEHSTDYVPGCELIITVDT